MRNLTLLTDLYQLTMLNGYSKTGQKDKMAVFDVFYRGVNNNYAIACGLQQVIDYINAEDYEGLRAMAVDEMADIMNQERMDEAKARVSEDWGAFQDVDSITTTEVNQRGKTAAVAYVAASYENVDIRYTFAFDEDLKLASLGIQ